MTDLTEYFAGDDMVAAILFAAAIGVVVVLMLREVIWRIRRYFERGGGSR